MFPWSKLLAVGLLFYVGYLIYKGEVDFTNRRRYKAPTMIYKRSENPLMFWGIVGAFILIAVFVFTLPM